MFITAGGAISAVKKARQSIYAKAEASSAVMDVWNSNGQELTERGKERKRGVLTYVRAHLEELRPVDMKLVNKPVAYTTRAPTS
jgi:hypothetical protein